MVVMEISVTKNFPFTAYLLVVITVSVFFFTGENTEYFNIYGFVPAFFRPYTFFSYIFFHRDFVHLMFNMTLLLVAGLLVEKSIGRLYFLLTYLFSGFVSAIFDGFGRVLLDFSIYSPLIGASGAVLGVLTLTALLKPFERIPSLFLVIPLFFLLLKFTILLAKSGMLILLAFLILISSIMGVFASFIFSSKHSVPLIFLPVYYLLFSLCMTFIKIQTFSSFGHIGGILGGFFCFLLFSLFSLF